MNPWLWPRLLGDLSHYTSDIDLVGIGSILDERLFNNRRKVIFGSGVRQLSFKIDHPDYYDLRFVRGPISAMVLDCDYIADSAYCLGLLEDNNPVNKIYRQSYIPYFRHYNGFDWKAFSDLTGFNIINPLAPVEEVIAEIKKSDYIVSSAMHGAILADLYRVPWKRLKIGRHGKESYETSALKWLDFTKGMEIRRYSTIEVQLDINDSRNYFKKLWNKGRINKLVEPFLNNDEDYILSNDRVLNNKFDRLDQSIESLKRTYRE